MKYALILITAYLIGGVIYVWGDLRAHVVSQPAYAREFSQRGRVAPLIVAAFAWLPPALLRRRFGPFIAAATVVIFGLYLSGI